MSFLQPWILLRLLAGLTALALFLGGAAPSLRVLRHFDVRRASEGQLAIERQMELATTFVRVGAIVQVGAMVLTILAADRLSHSVRGAMCAYGVFQDNRWGFPALGMSALVAWVAAVSSQLCAFDRRVRGLEVVRSIAVANLVLAPLAMADLGLTAQFFGRLDLGAVASCCSTQLDATLSTAKTFATGSRGAVAWAATLAVVASVGMAWVASVRPRRGLAAIAAVVNLCAVPLAFDAAMLEVAPHAFELPQHTCPFCLLHADVLWMGYPLFGAVFLSAQWAGGTAIAALASRSAPVASAFRDFARTRLRRGAWAWLVAAIVATTPIVHHTLASNGRSLFP